MSKTYKEVQREPLTLKPCVTVASLPGAAFVSAGYSLEATLCSLQTVALIKCSASVSVFYDQLNCNRDAKVLNKLSLKWKKKS